MIAALIIGIVLGVALTTVIILVTHIRESNDDRKEDLEFYLDAVRAAVAEINITRKTSDYNKGKLEAYDRCFDLIQSSQSELDYDDEESEGEESEDGDEEYSY